MIFQDFMQSFYIIAKGNDPYQIYLYSKPPKAQTQIPFLLGAVWVKATRETEQVQPAKEFFGYFFARKKVTRRITHHIPTLFNYPAKYKNKVLNEAFAVELFNLIDNSGPDYWIYGPLP